MVHTTLNNIRVQGPCVGSRDSLLRLLAALGKSEADDEPLPLVRILEINGLDDALRSLCTTECEREARLFAVACARQVQHLMTDDRSLTAVDVAERYLNGEATKSELSAAAKAARTARRSYEAASETAWEATGTVWYAAAAAARSARTARTAVMDTAIENARTAGMDATERAAAAAAAGAAASEKQAELFKQIFG